MSIISLVIHFCSVIDHAIFVKAAIQLAFLVVFKFYTKYVFYFVYLLMRWQTELEVHDLYSCVHGLDLFAKQRH